MAKVSLRGIQATNMFFSSWALIFLTLGILREEWVELTLETKKNTISHSPWICCTTLWPEDGLEVVRIMMILCLSLSFVHNLFLGLEFTYFIPQTKYVFFITVFLSFFTGILLLCALILYQLKLKQGQSVYYSTYKITWIIFTAYLSVSFFMASGILSLLECKKSTSACACATLIHTPERESEDIEESESSVKIVSLPENAAAPRSIVHTREGSPNRPQLQTRRVTWAL
ncbi:transmembrane protein 225 isoform X2 [Canis lupus baileyi]|uniref:Transmembrane protein 225 n=1 Tax=Canis lupus familiaris TaxID=9615 RepID=A0A8C0LWL5_CANLF|nr:transmembrane protein 225 isoform X4 [Canis lupus familiaris]XP_852701.1 transmembrane protein 225 isoform X4 [Canis lupus familiaris]|eukprot:XP_852701.1 transmembrane protein 225 isoform X2 [Canis lupus familiaris]